MEMKIQNINKSQLGDFISCPLSLLKCWKKKKIKKSQLTSLLIGYVCMYLQRSMNQYIYIYIYNLFFLTQSLCSQGTWGSEDPKVVKEKVTEDLQDRLDSQVWMLLNWSIQWKTFSEISHLKSILTYHMPCAWGLSNLILGNIYSLMCLLPV